MKNKKQNNKNTPIMSTSPIPQEEAGMLRKQGRGKITSDILGSYTGTPDDGEIPEQDADDL